MEWQIITGTFYFMPHLKEKGKLNKTNAFIDEQDVTFYRSAPWWRPGGMTQQTGNPLQDQLWTKNRVESVVIGTVSFTC